ncbi:AfsR/SARP family transcriptional regulator [Nonomuraea candida]|uniref:AfsR/SARP family transcriptional regulator n=1 Tax=Nonomuraea candida TaxID=359159 RepID=UPI000693CBEA|nr:tetratricopeptide repeat protein [Nonomuraea candida]
MHASVADRPIDLGVRKQRFVLALLALEVNKQVTTERLVELIWPRDPPVTARGMIHTYISGLRGAIARANCSGVSVERTVGAYRLCCDPDHIDVHRFRALLTEAKIADDETKVELLHRALALWRGPALAGAAPEDVRETVCRGLDEARLTAVEDLIAAQLRLGRHEELLERLLSLAAEHPGRPRLIGGLMQALHRAGRTAEALTIYQQTRQHLGDELGLDPPAELQELHLSIVRNDPVRAPGTAPRHDPAPAPRQLPADLPAFVGRADDLKSLLALADDERAGSTVVVGMIDGMAGIGKTALAVHAAHRLADRFPDGQLFVDLHGFTHGVTPATPADALYGLLCALDIPRERIPRRLDERAALLRSTLAGRRVLILLDNALGEAQIQPLLPGSPGCLVLITSRHRLDGLDDAHRIRLEALPRNDAIAMFTRIAGDGHPHALVAELVELCGRLPLAIRVAAARLRARPAWTLAHLVDRLRDPNRRLAELEVGQRSVTSAIDLSYRQLTPAQQRLFRLLGLHPGPDADAYSAAALADTTLDQADRLLDDLLEAGLVHEPMPGRYRIHDLLRAYAAAEESGSQRQSALGRLLDYYTHTAAKAMKTLYPFATPQRPRAKRTPAPVPSFPTPSHAKRWLNTELANLLATARQEQPGHAPHLPAILHLHLRTRGARTEPVHTRVLQIAKRTRDEYAQAEALLSLGELHLRSGRFAQADDLLSQALALAQAIGHVSFQTEALTSLGEARLQSGLHRQAYDCYERALSIATETGHLAERADALGGLGHAHLQTGRLDEAGDCLHDALTASREIGHPAGELTALLGLGRLHLRMSNRRQASEHFQECLALCRRTANTICEVYALLGLGYVGRREEGAEHFRRALTAARRAGDRVGEMWALIGLGHCHRRAARHDRAEECFSRALALSDELRHPAGRFEATHGLGYASIGAGRFEQAVAYQQAALDQLKELGHRHDEARVHHGLAMAYHALGRTDRAWEHRRQAWRMVTPSKA